MDERRKFKRYTVQLEATLQEGTETSRECMVSDVSLEGIRLLVPDKIRFGQTLTLTIRIPGTPEPVVTRMTVRWTRPFYEHEKFAYVAGGELSAEDGAGELLVRYGSAAHNVQ